ncbi:MAG: hypothetical protein COV99_10840 [Bacteroidetes bacterium CG12_big_fil_rev_8_21_14_0_65_60_17]|nr:MAG: hypothetical protein COV99_10840 [Bacteroidetes bacterium CG12_big_fil_rev_8_21_14_0_65_60_17]
MPRIVPYIALFLVAAGLALFPNSSAARQTDPQREPGQQEAPSGLGAQVLLTNSGFGLGGYLRRLLRDDQTATLEISLSAAEDEREVSFFDRFGDRDVPNKRTYLLEIPIHIGLERRLFRPFIEDNFRPYFHIAGGPVLGWNYPYFRDENGNDTFDDGERTFGVISGMFRGRLVPGLGLSVSIGANFGELEGVTQGVRLGFRMNVYNEDIELLEPAVKAPDNVLTTPFIMFHFGRQRQ